jgi:hypothetical protein
MMCPTRQVVEFAFGDRFPDPILHDAIECHFGAIIPRDAFLSEL